MNKDLPSAHSATAAAIGSAFPVADGELAAVAAYVQALKDHNWEFEHSDVHAAWVRGHNSLNRLRKQQRELDPHFVLWNIHCPESHRKAATAVAPALTHDGAVL